MAGGLREIRDQQAHQAQIVQAGKEMWEEHCREARRQMEDFQKKLQEFASKHKDQIKKDPEFRREFNAMCLSLGVDPLQSKNGFWSKLLGVGDFYHELSVKVIDVCVSLKKKYGALVPLDKVIQDIMATYPDKKKAPKITDSDIEAALRSLKTIGQGYAVIQSNKKKYVQTVSFDLDQDAMAVLDLAKDTGYFSAASNTVLPPEKFEAAKNKLLNEGLIWVDGADPTGPVWYVCAMFAGFN
jgi:ESCRT-II complex subunit VPS22